MRADSSSVFMGSKQFLKTIRAQILVLPSRLRNVINNIRARVILLAKRRISQFWPRFYSLRYHMLVSKHRYKAIAVMTAVPISIGSTVYLVSVLQTVLEPGLTEQNNLANFRALFLNMGSALIGAAAIAFSLVMFAMQVNVERMPHGLFQTLSEDVRILAAFVSAFLLAIFVACISLWTDKEL